MDRLSMLQYTANLAVVDHRYGEFERRVPDLFTVAQEGPPTALVLTLPGGRDLDLWYLLRDGLIRNFLRTRCSPIRATES
jgi:hypothetical protein